MASKSIRDRRLTGTRIPAWQKDAAIFYFADNLAATVVAEIVGISLDSARGIRDREQKRIMKVREAITREYERLWKRDLDAYYKREAEWDHRRFMQEVKQYQRKMFAKHKGLEEQPSRANFCQIKASRIVT